MDLTAQQLATYRATAMRQRQQELPEIQRRQEQAWQAARRAARLLKEQFGATRVVAFGSLVREACFTRWSDVDLAAWDIAPADTFLAIGAVMDSATEIQVNLVDINTCSTALRAVIEQEGIDL